MSDKNSGEKKPKKQRFGQIPADLICRFGELTKNEIMVVSFLYLCRNKKTGRCDPGRKTISTATKLDKGNLSKTIGGLEEKGWIVENQNGHFDLIGSCEINNSKVVKSTTKKLLNSQQKVVKSTTKSCEINNSHIKELNRQRTDKEHIRKNVSETSSDVCVFDFRVDAGAFEIFDEWRRVLNHPKASYDEKRQKKILAARKRFSAADLKRAIRGVTFSPHHLGDNASGKKYDGISTIFRDTEQIEKFIGYAEEVENIEIESQKQEAAKDEQQEIYSAMLAKARSKSQHFEEAGKS